MQVIQLKGVFNKNCPDTALNESETTTELETSFILDGWKLNVVNNEMSNRIAALLALSTGVLRVLFKMVEHQMIWCRIPYLDIAIFNHLNLNESK